jgi:hypothetical protein
MTHAKTFIGHSIDRVRQNHALEHATIAVLMESGIDPPLAGYSVNNGFVVYGLVPTEILSKAASHALERLKSGERELAVSVYCGTNLVVSATIAGLFGAAILQKPRHRWKRLPLVLAGGILAAIVGKPLGKEAQRRYTTLPEVQNVEITDVGQLGLIRLHWISTRSLLT